jgi:hypothetical protein
VGYRNYLVGLHGWKLEGSEQFEWGIISSDNTGRIYHVLIHRCG